MRRSQEPSDEDHVAEFRKHAWLITAQQCKRETQPMYQHMGPRETEMTQLSGTVKHEVILRDDDQPARQTRTSRSTRNSDRTCVEASTRTQGGSSVARVARHVARWNARADSAKPQGSGTPTAFWQQVQNEVDRHVVTLDEKDDQKIFQDDSSLQRMRRLIRGERRGSGSITCWDTRNIKNTGAIGWQGRDDDLEG